VIKIEINDRALRQLAKKVTVLAAGGWKSEVHRGLIDAGRRTTTPVMKAAQGQMAAKCYGFVRNRTRQKSSDSLEYRILSHAGGARIEEYRGLRSVKSGRLASPEAGGVSSAVWNSPRTFKRSFAASGGFFAMLPSGTQLKNAPKILWTYGEKPDQPRDGRGRFAPSNRTYGPIRRLFGPALNKELTQGETLATFMRVAPVMMEQKIMPRLEKLIKF